MSIQPAVQVGKWMYKVNPLQLREILKKPNRRGGRWVRHQVFVSEEAARQSVFKLQREAESGGDE